MVGWLRSFVIEQYIDDLVVNQQRDHFLTLLAQLPFAAESITFTINSSELETN